MHWKDYDWEKAETEDEKPDYRWMLEPDHREKQWRKDRKMYIQLLKNDPDRNDDYLYVDELYGWQYEK